MLSIDLFPWPYIRASIDFCKTFVEVLRLKYRYKCRDRASELPSYDEPSGISYEMMQIICGENDIISDPKNNRNYRYQMYIVGKCADPGSLSKISEKMMHWVVEDY
jgi:hypothetical protein